MYFSPTGVPVFVFYCSYYSFPVRSLTLGLYSWVSIPGCLSSGLYPWFSRSRSFPFFSLTHTSNSLPALYPHLRPSSLSLPLSITPSPLIHTPKLPISAPSQFSTSPSSSLLALAIVRSVFHVFKSIFTCVFYFYFLSSPHLHFTRSLAESPAHLLTTSSPHLLTPHSQTLPLTNFSTH